MSKRAKRVSQIGVLVWDLDKAVEKYQKYFGLSDWEYADLSKIPVDLLVNDKPGRLNIKSARAEVSDGLFIEIIQPVGEGEFMDYLREHGPGIHHFTFMLRDKNAEFQQVMDEITEDGNEPFVRAKMVGVPEGEGMDLAFLDLRRDLGAIVEIYNERKE